MKHFLIGLGITAVASLLNGFVEAWDYAWAAALPLLLWTFLVRKWGDSWTSGIVWSVLSLVVTPMAMAAGGFKPELGPVLIGFAATAAAGFIPGRSKA